MSLTLGCYLVASRRREISPSLPLEEVCGLDADIVGRFRDIFQFSERVRVRRPNDENRA